MAVRPSRRHTGPALQSGIWLALPDWQRLTIATDVINSREAASETEEGQSYVAPVGRDRRGKRIVMRFIHAAVQMGMAILITSPISAQTPADSAAPPQTSAGQQTINQDPGLGKTPEDIGFLLQQTDQSVDALFSHGPMQPLYDVWKPLTEHLKDRAGLDLGMNYTAIYQNSSYVRAGSKDAAGGDYDFFGSWHLCDSDECGPASLVFSSESRDWLDNIPPAALDTGTTSGTIVGFGRQDFSLVQLYWEQGTPEDGFLFRLGRMDPALIWDGGRYVSSNFAFLSPAYSDTLPMALPGAGLGFAAAIYPTEETYITAGFHDANGRRTTAGFDTFFNNGEYFSAVEFGWFPNEGEADEGLYHVTLWNIDARRNAGRPGDSGIALTMEQQVGCTGNIVPFLRYAHASRGINGIRQNASVGVGFEEVFGRNFDLIGVAASWEEPANQTLRDQYIVEAFYRFHVTPLIHVTPDIQIVMNPAGAPTKDTVAIPGLRLRMIF